MSLMPQAEAPAVSERRPVNVGRWLRTFGTLFVFLLMIIFFAVRSENFLTPNNLLNILSQNSALAVVAFTMTIVMVVGDFDLSVGTMATLSGIVAGVMFQQGFGIPEAVGAALLVGLLGGLLNGFLVSYIGISAFIATLGTQIIFSGLAFTFSDGNTIFGRTIPAAFGLFGNSGIEIARIGEQTIRLSNITIVMLIVLAVVWIILEQTVFGRRLYAIGGNREAARMGGVKVRWLRMLAFVLSAVGAAGAGLLTSSRVASMNPTLADGLMLDAIATVFLGMTMSQEGEPHVLGTFVGVLILGVLKNGMTILSVESYPQQILMGVLIVVAVTISSLSRRSAT